MGTFPPTQGLQKDAGKGSNILTQMFRRGTVFLNSLRALRTLPGIPIFNSLKFREACRKLAATKRAAEEQPRLAWKDYAPFCSWTDRAGTSMVTHFACENVNKPCGEALRPHSKEASTSEYIHIDSDIGLDH